MSGKAVMDYIFFSFFFCCVFGVINDGWLMMIVIVDNGRESETFT